jgi:PAS domain S-box-containing protein
MGEDTDINALLSGATDYVLKNKFDRLLPAINRAINEIELEKKSKLAEVALKTSEVRYRRLFESAKDGILILDAESGKIVDVNPFLINLLGYSKEDFIERKIWEIGFLQDLVANYEKFLELQQKEYVRYDNLPLKTATGQKINVEFISNVYIVNHTNVIQCNIRNITERKQSENKIVVLAHSLESINECVSISDLENKIIFVNNSFLKTYGYNESELIGQDIHKIQSSKRFPLASNKTLHLTMGSGWQGELINKKKDGTEFQVQLSTTIVYDTEGNTLGLIGVASDITQRKLEEQELVKAKENAEESNILKTAFLQNMSHEIRTPLNGIIGFSKLLLDEDVSNIEIRDYSNIIIQSGNRLLEIVNNVLDISKIQTGQIEINKKEIEIRTLFYNLFRFFIPIANNKNISLVYHDSNETYSPFFSDEAKLQQILTNLISNALKFIKSGTIDYGYEIIDHYIKFYVSDTGIGIPANMLNKIFDRFVQTDQAMKMNYEGAGLGLSISKGLVELMGGEIWVESEIKKVTTFYFTLPYTKKLISTKKKECL